MNKMKYRIQDNLGLPYSNYHVSFCFEFDFLSGKKEKKNLNRKENSYTRTGYSWYTNMVVVSLFWDANMATVTSCENALYFAKLL